ncbi:MAG: CBS domain-containing protein [Planctomycetes bacterium]|nr:CBS domain-containing protein [Planctomycetota bacterium]MBI3832849.1 CBS domain-containing protein [Planctomycetota bacterium]
MAIPSNISSAALVHEIMSRDLHTLLLDDSLRTATRLFRDEKFHHAIVLEKTRVFGVVSDRDILKAVSPFADNPLMARPQDLGTLNKRVHQIMTRKPVTIGPSETIVAAAQKMIDEDVSCLPVVEESGELVGIITLRDLAKQFLL